jgi:glycerol-3-phosphate dehydrogenase
MTSSVIHSNSLDFRDRPQLFRSAEESSFDVVIIGAGITGAGIAREASRRGLTVAVVEALDIASGTSSRSSKMIHGGVRYLAQGDVSLVREAATERQILRRIAPHLTRFMPFLLPTRSKAGLAKFRAAMWTFEKIGQVPSGERHRVWNKAQLEEREPLACVEGMNGAVQYFEFLTDDARLTLANVRSAVSDGAKVLTYAPVREILFEGGRAVGVRCESALESESLEACVRGRIIVNAAGPWVDALRALEAGGGSTRLSLTKGVHVVVPRSRLPLSNTVLMNAADGRPVFAVPRGDVSYLGTTDTFYPNADLWPEINQDDVDYLFDAASRTFTVPALETRDVVTSWTGIRPLVSQAGKSPSEISRRDEVWTSDAGIMSIAGGKLTAYRAMAERVVDSLAKRLGKAVEPVPKDDSPLVGGDFSPPSIDIESPVGGSPRDRLVDLYGSEAGDVASDGGDLLAEVRHAVRREGALRLEDYWVRRSARALFDPDAGLESIEPASLEMAGLLGWSEVTRQSEVKACRIRHETNNAIFIEARMNGAGEEKL